jgi:beta-N-acetylhexosaminidase
MHDSSSLRGFEFSGVFRKLKISKARTLFVLAAALFFSWASFAKEPAGDWTERTLKSLSLREKIGQLIQIRVPGKFINRKGYEYQSIQEQVKKNHVGGVVLFAGSVYESAILLNELQVSSKIPLLVAADFERGLSFRIGDTTPFPWTMALGAAGSEPFAYQQGLVTGQESRALGVHWIFAPVMDVNNNPDNPVINIRSFGEDPALVARLGSAFIKGAKKAQVLTTAKHFPGHGDTSTDSHLGLAVVESDLARLQAVEFVPFKEAIQAGVDSIMTAHVAVPNLTNSPSTPATLSWKVLTDVLRNNLKFDGIVVTDALEMGGITESYWGGLAAVRAVQAGADVLLLPLNVTVAINEVERAVLRGDIPESRIDTSVRKILSAKYRLGLQRKRTVPISQIADVIALPRNTRLAQEIADQSVTVVKDDQHLLPVNALNDTQVFSLVLASDFESTPGSAFQAELKRHFGSVRTAWGNARLPDDVIASIDKGISGADLVICSTMARLGTGQDSLAIPAAQQTMLKKLAASKKPFIWIAFGNPYVLRLVPEAGTYLCTFSYSEVSQIAAAKAIAGEIPVTGRMPVSIPGFSKVGDGLQIPRLPMELQWAPRPDRFESSKRLLSSFIADGIFRGAELLIGRKGTIVADSCAGQTGPANRQIDVSPKSYFDLASLSKVIDTISSSMLAIDSGTLLPAVPVRDYLPELSSESYAALRVQEMLKGFSQTNSTIMDSRSSILNKIVTRVTGLPADRYLTSTLYDALGIDTRQQGAGGRFRFRGRDLAVFAQMLLDRGMYDHHRCLKAETIARYTSAQGPWTKPSGFDWMASLFSASSFGHISQAGSMLWVDPSKQMFIVLATDRNSKSDATVSDAQRKLLESILSELTDNE